MKKFLENLKEESLPGVWSKGVQASRVLNSIEKTSPEGNPEELRFKITTSERMLAFEVTLWPAELDAHCNCGSKVEPCHHIVAVALALEAGTLKSKSESPETPNLRLEYSWIYQAEDSGKPARIRLKRALMKGAEEIPIPASLVAWVGGVRSGRLNGPLPSISPVDLKIDGIYSSDTPEWRELLRALSDLPPLPVVGHPSLSALRVQTLPERPKPILKNLGPDEWALEFGDDPDLQVLQGGLWIKNGVLGHGHEKPLNYPTRFSKPELETSLLVKFPELKDLFQSVIEGEPELELTLHPLSEDRFSATLRIKYPSQDGALVLRDPKKEAELHRIAREEYQLAIDQPKTLEGSELLRLRGNGAHSRFPEIESTLGSWLKSEFQIDLSDAISRQETILKLLRLKESKPSARPKIKALLTAFSEKTETRGSEPDQSIPDFVREKLRPYQVSGVNWLLHRWKTLGGAILADDMGLGKTLQTLAILKSPSLIVVPVSLLQNWKAEAARFRPDLKVSIYHGPGRTFDEKADVILTSYSLLGAEAERFGRTNWKVAVLDEAHIIRNPETRAALATSSLTADFRLALTGTPIQNRLRDLWSLFQFVSPGLFGSEDSLDLNTSKPFFLRRTKTEVLPELPPKTHLTHTLPFSESESTLYRSLFLAAKQELISRMDLEGENLSPLSMFEVLLRARQACNHEALLGAGPDIASEAAPTSTKLDAILALASELLEAGHSVLVYSQWTGFLDLLETRANAESMPYQRLDGSTKARGEVTRSFQESDRASVFLLSLHAGGVGLNLTRASHVIFCEPWWNPFVELQAEDRAYRMGQEKPVTIHRFRIGGSIEERMEELQKEKLALGEGALTSGDLKRLLEEG
ncbi:MAG: DEAD/DEAH box helicase [Bdellovibrionales bacterium]|nr:DEAD/DEAH box helicase [Bdellovibrionales bacterium]